MEAVDVSPIHWAMQYYVEIVDDSTQVYKDYKKAAGSTKSLVKHLNDHKNRWLSKDDSQGAEPTQMDFNQ